MPFRTPLGATAIVALAAASVVNADVLVQWNFNDQTLTPSAGTMAPTATIGTVGGVNGSFATGAGSSDPVQPGSGWQTTGYPSQGTGSGSAGIELSVSTVGYESIALSWDLRPTNTASRWAMLTFSTDGGELFHDGDIFEMAAGAVWFSFGQTLPSLHGVADAPMLVVRIVSVYGPNGFGFEAAQAGSNYGGGAWRFDMVTVTGTPTVVPAPGVAALLAMATLAGCRGRRRA